MTIFANYKCPNGLPPEDCRHAPRLIANLASYFANKQAISKSQVNDISSTRNTNHTKLNTTSSSRVRTRG